MAGIALEQQAVRPSSRRMVRYALVALGSLLVAIGVLGIFLPLLPSTVFFLMAAGCYGKSSPSAYTWLTTNRVFGRHLREYKEEKGATVVTKVTTLASLWGGIVLADYLTGFNPWLSIVLMVIATGVSIHILRLNTVRR